jgi:pentatricopeptide repeat protein
MHTKQTGVTCNEVTYNSLVQLFVKGEDLKGARGVLTEIKQADVRCDEVTYNSLVKCYALYAPQRTGEMLEPAGKLISDMGQ